jgi:hypothetical protein
MLLFHITEKRFLKLIIKSGYILSSSVTKKQSQTPYFDHYLEYIFMSTCPENLDNISKNKYMANAIFFDSSILYDRVYYTCDCHTAGNTKTCDKYPKEYVYTNKILNKLYKKSASILTGEMFMIFQEIFFKRKLSLKYAKYITLPEDHDGTVEKLLKKKYPHIKIIIVPGRFTK